MNPTPSTDTIEELIERLNVKGYVASMQRVDASTAKIFINPDGPEAAQAITTLSARVRELEEALKPFVDRFAEARESYAKRYCADHEIGFKNFDKMPDEWPMEKLQFNMGTYRRAAEAYAALSRPLIAGGGVDRRAVLEEAAQLLEGELLSISFTDSDWHRHALDDKTMEVVRSILRAKASQIRKLAASPSAAGEDVEDDISPEAVAYIQNKADEAMKGGVWKQIDPPPPDTTEELAKRAIESRTDWDWSVARQAERAYAKAAPPELWLALSARVRELEGALNAAQEALKVWVCLYAPDMCDEVNVEITRQKLNEGGTLWFIASVNETITRALSPKTTDIS